ncbi:hypothetical protein PEX1_003960 [Penicillium expansum]|nr:hypothetical protein PEX1_003960 [Penicillium expansum]
MEIALNGKNLTYWGLLTGIEGRPRDLTGDEASQPGADKEVEDQRNAVVLSYVVSTLDITMSVYLCRGRRIRNDRVQSQQQASSNVALTDKKKKDKKKKDSKKDSKDSKDQVWCPFHKRETVHKPADCFLNPKNKKDSKPESANKADTKPAAANAASLLPDNLWVSATYVNINSVSATVSLNNALDPNVWMLDSGCSAYITPCRSVFHTFTAKTLPIHSATGKTFYAEGYGDIVIDLTKFDYSVNDQDTTERIRIRGIVLRKVWYALSLKHSLISTRQLAETGTIAITFFKDHTKLKSMITGEVKGYTTVGNNQYWLYTYKNAQISHLRSLIETNCLIPSVSAVENTTGLPEDDNLFVSASKVSEPISILMDLTYRRAYYAGESQVKKTQDYTDGLIIKKKSALT